jgi:hypothetical protein
MGGYTYKLITKAKSKQDLSMGWNKGDNAHSSASVS